MYLSNYLLTLYFTKNQTQMNWKWKKWILCQRSFEQHGPHLNSYSEQEPFLYFWPTHLFLTLSSGIFTPLIPTCRLFHNLTISILTLEGSLSEKKTDLLSGEWNWGVGMVTGFSKKWKFHWPDFSGSVFSSTE